MTAKSYQDSVHANIRKFACDRCDYRAKEASNLKKHQRVVHDKLLLPGVKLECQECDYVAARPDALLAHRQFIFYFSGMYNSTLSM